MSDNDDTLSRCDRCEKEFYYDPAVHRCPGEWEAMVGTLEDPHAGESWADECVRKVMS